jgi:hypothetical protein
MTADVIQELVRTVGKKPNPVEIIYSSACSLVGLVGAWLFSNSWGGDDEQPGRRATPR